MRPWKSASPEQSVTLAATTLSAFVAAIDVSSVNIALPTIGRDLANRLHRNRVGRNGLPPHLRHAPDTVRQGFRHLRKEKGLHNRDTHLYGGHLFPWYYAIPGAPDLPARCSGRRLCNHLRHGNGPSDIGFSSPRGRGKALGINVAATYTGIAVGPMIGGFMVEYCGWRSIFLVNVPLGLLIVAMVAWKLHSEWTGKGGAVRHDRLRRLLSGPDGDHVRLQQPGVAAAPRRHTAMIIAGVLAILFFIRWELGVKNPVLQVSLFRSNRTFAFSNLAALINYSATFAVSFFLSLYLQYIKGMSPAECGLHPGIRRGRADHLLAGCGVGLRLDRNPRILSSIGMALTATALFMLAFLHWETSLYLYSIGPGHPAFRFSPPRIRMPS